MRRAVQNPVGLGLLAMLVLLVACGPSEETEPRVTAGSHALYDLGDTLVFEGDLLVVPGPRIAPYESEPVGTGAGQPGAPSKTAEGWVFHGFARLLCPVRQQPSDPLRLRFRPDPETATFFFDVRWDGERLAAEQVSKIGEMLEIVIPPASLEPGLHQMEIRRRHPPGTRFAEVRHANVFTHLAYAVGGVERTLLPGEHASTFLLGEWLLHGVLGSEKERLSGLVFAGGGEHRVALPEQEGGRAAGHLVVEPKNFSPGPARYRVSDAHGQAEVRLAPGESATLELDLADGAEELVFEVEPAEIAGSFPGLHFWGTPLYRPASPPAGERPPIIVITLDTTRRDALGPYRGSRPGPDPSPQITRWAGGATVFERAHSTAPWTLPSHASIFTGLYPSRHRAGTHDVQVPVGLPTLAALLRRHGYVTLGISAGEMSSSRFGLAQGFHRFRNPDRFQTSGEQVDAYAGELLEEYADTPFFLWLNYFDPHALYQAPKEYERRFSVAEKGRALAGLAGWEDLAAGKMDAWRAAVEGELEMTPEVAEYLEAAYLAEIAWTDHLMGRLFERLEALGLHDDALIIVTADHGELLGEGGYVSHGARLDPELVEIPLIVKWPGQREGGRDRRLVSLVDIFPTVLAAAGIEPPPSDGHLLVRGDETSLRRFTILEEHEFLVHPLPRFMKVANRLYGIQRPNYRQLVWNGGEECARLKGGSWQTEPCETPRDTVLSSLDEMLGVDAEGEGTASAETGLSPEEQERLEALGYM